MSKRDIILIIIFLSLSFIVKWKLDDFFMNTLYTVLGIMFSIGIGLVVTFDMRGLVKKNIIQKIRNNLNFVRNSYIKYFTISTIFYILEKYFRTNVPINLYGFNLSVFTLSVIIFSIAYCIYNFLKIQKLKEDIFDELNK